MKKISFILPIFNEEGNIPKLWNELNIIKNKLKNYEFEFIFVNDFSTDNSIFLLNEIFQKNVNCVKIRSFSRNYGHQIAVSSGQDIADGDAIIIMDTDLQDPPEVSIDLIKKWEEGFEVVYAQRRKYKTNFVKEISAFVFYRLLAAISEVKIPVDTGDFRLISKRVNEEMKKYKEKSKFLRGISCLIGFNSTSVIFDRQERYSGKPGYTLIKSLKLAMDGITGFSTVPLKLINYIGFSVSFLSILVGIFYVLFAIFTKSYVPGWASILLMISFLGGMQILMIGIIGIYISRIYIETLDRPLYTVDFDLSKENKPMYAGILKQNTTSFFAKEKNEEIVLRIENWKLRKEMETNIDLETNI
jgi:polyisoprenyl-phosphate glycosyltransferase